ncbi:MAG: protein BatD [Hyphomicrobiales bacterium]|nr:protein BatD [Hyphomicrobiales bacterium]
MRVLAALASLFLLLAPASAQQADVETEADTTPILRMSLDEDGAIPGQPLVLRVDVLAPTFLPQPPVFPSFEVPGVMVRLPERASGPTSDSIGGETWSGVTRAYRLIPMTPGQFRIPSQTVAVTYADPDTSEPLKVDLQTDEIVFNGLTPEGAEDLDPFIAAEKVELKQELVGDPAALAPGDAVERVVTARITGTSPLFLPPMIAPVETTILSSYPAEPSIEETEDRGVLSGVRTERVTYVAEAGGTAAAPEINLSWFNIETNKVETATAPGLDFAIDGPAAPQSTTDWRALVPYVLLALVVLAVIALALWLLWPRIAAWRRRRREVWLASEAFAYRQAQAAVRSRDFGETVVAIARWKTHLPDNQWGTDARLAAAMTRLGESYYGRASEAHAPKSGAWSDVLSALRGARRSRRQSADRSHGHVLPPLNPV